MRICCISHIFPANFIESTNLKRKNTLKICCQKSVTFHIEINLGQGLDPLTLLKQISLLSFTGKLLEKLGIFKHSK